MAMSCLTVEPAESGKGLEFVNKIVGGSIPKEYIPAIEKGVRERHGDRSGRRLSSSRCEGDGHRWVIP